MCQTRTHRDTERETLEYNCRDRYITLINDIFFRIPKTFIIELFKSITVLINYDKNRGNMSSPLVRDSSIP